MNVDNVLNEIQDLNLTYLLLAQRLLQEDYATAVFRLKIDEPMAEVLLSLSARQLSRLARTNQFLFRLGLDDAGQLQALTNHKREQGLEQTHAALLMTATGDAVAARQG
ncbi:flagellar transcriptional activator FlhD [Alloalcanivorax xenomutans]|uniref:flagellar transcriptional regulator FlhD n=1 Tax=Alloalcanivorax xenomutans TaxID=1094342 RepID=UPI000BDAC630|nr:flagellar transcriptional regulator FlhD [Alloalcanivorax xenomutans]SOC18494.1 flagellar transcriptional activator FlhD [Alloalcanivorax xenomutans]